MPDRVPVLIVGAGPTGLVLSAYLARFGVESLAIDRDAGVTDHPQAHVVNGRSVEIFRSLGVADAIAARALPRNAGGFVRWVESIAGREFAELVTAPTPDEQALMDATTPCSPCSTAQDEVEPILLEAARREGAQIEFATRLVELSQTPDGVLATVETGGVRRQIEADWLVGCDGAGSTTRRQTGIEMIGPEMIARVVGIYFHADLGDLVADRPSVLYWTLDAEMPGTFIAMDGRHRWVFHAPSPEAEFDLADYTDERCQAILRRAIGADVDIDIRSVKPWVMTAQIAERYRHGRVLLAGDAAHRFPPTGGFGMNTGVQDAHNLAWKLAAVVRGDADEALLDTYETERKPIAAANSDWSVRNSIGIGEISGPGARAQGEALASGEVTFDELSEKVQAIADQERSHFGAFGRDLGFHYDDGAFVGDGTPPPVYDNPDTDYVQNAVPGGRAPHLPVTRNGESVSTIDLFDSRWTLIHGAIAADRWAEAAAAQAIDVEAIAIGADVSDPSGRFAELFGVADGAVLVRPDGHTAWRSASLPADPTGALSAALNRILRS